MSALHNRLSVSAANLDTRFRISILAFVTATVCYLAARLGGALIINIPQTVWPLWPGCAVLVAILLLAPRKIWPILLPTGLAGFVLYDLQAGVSISRIVWLILADTLEVLVAAWGLSYSLNGLPRLNSLKALAKYSFFTVFLAPLVVSSIGIHGLRGDSWLSWRFSFLSEALAFLTVTPAILGLLGQGQPSLRTLRAHYLEAAILVSALTSLSYFMLVAPGRGAPPALLYSLVPFLIWSALRFGSTGVGASASIVALVSIWGAVHGRGPFSGGDPINQVLFLQVFLFFTSMPFMVLAVLVEERKCAQDELHTSEERLRLAMDSGKLGGWEWDIKSGRNPWFGGKHNLLGMTSADRSGSVQDFWDRVHSEDLHHVREAAEIAKQSHGAFEQEFRVVWPDGTVHWLRSVGRFFYGPDCEPERMLGISTDITERKIAEQALLQREGELTEAQSLAQVGSWRWDVKTDTVSWSKELYRIAGMDPGMPAVSYKDHSKLYTAESWERLRAAVEEALRSGRPYELDLEMIRVDGARRWLIARGEPHRDASGAVVQLRGTVHDITERKRTEEALRESEERLRLAIQAGKMFAYEWDATTDVIVRSAESTQILGIDEAAQHTGQQPLANVHPGDRERLKAAITELTPETPYLEISYRIVRPDGTLLWVERNSRAHFDEHGRMLRMVGMMADVTERKRAEEALRESEARFRLVANTAPVLIWMADTNKLCSYFNTSWLDFTGRSIESEVGNGWAEGVHPEDFKTCLETYTKAFDRRERFSMEYRLRRRDGEYRWVLDIGVPRFNQDGSFAGFIGSGVDVTDRRAAEEALRENEDRLRLLLDSTAEAIYGIDLEGRCTFCNPACLRALGYQRVEGLLGKNMHNLIHHSRADGTMLPAETSRIMRALQTGKGVHADDEVLWDAKGKSFPAEYWSYPQRKGQEIVGAVVTFLDITERKQAEVALENLSRRLIGVQEQERTRIARELHDDIGQRLALLTVELGQLPQESPDLPAEVGGRIDELRKQSSEIAVDVQSLSHELHSSKLEYLGIVTAMRGFCKEFSAQQNVEIVFAHDAISRMVPSDISLCLFRVLQEALHNAVKYSGVRHLDAQLRASSDAIDLTVRDSGSGFDVGEAMKAAGLGLISMAERVKLVGGQLSIESQPGRGTTIRARVPLREAALAAP